MQRAAIVAVVSALLSILMCTRSVTIVMRMLVIGVRRNRVRSDVRPGQRRRDDASELGDQEQRDQHAHRARHRPEPSHQRFGSPSAGDTGVWRDRA